MTDQIAAPETPASSGAAPQPTPSAPASAPTPSSTAAPSSGGTRPGGDLVKRFDDGGRRESPKTTMARAIEEAKAKNPNWKLKPDDPQPRAQDGKFAPKAEPADQAQRPQETKAAEKPPETGKPDAQKAPTRPAVTLPTSIPAKDREALAKQPPDVQELVVRLSRGFQSQATKAVETAKQRIQQAQQAATSLGGVAKVIAENHEDWARRGISPEKGFAQLAEMERRYNQDPASTIIELARIKGIDLAQLAQVAAEHNPQQAQLLRQTVAPVLSEIDQIKQVLAQRDRVEQEARSRQTLGFVERFATAVDGSGTPLRPHWERVRGKVLHQIGAIKAANPQGVQWTEDLLQDAYDAAVASDRELRAQMIEQERQALADRAKAEAAAKVQAARQASSSVTTQPIATTPLQTVPRRASDHLRQAFGRR